jgi:hypothetical protein
MLCRAFNLSAYSLSPISPISCLSNEEKNSSTMKGKATIIKLTIGGFPMIQSDKTAFNLPQHLHLVRSIVQEGNV